MATVILARHGRTAANATGVLAGRSEGVRLDDTGTGQAARAASRLEGLPLVQVVTSPLERCQQTAALLAPALTAVLDDRLLECDYGDWTGRELKVLAKEKMWRTVQTQPSAARFPGGESLQEVSARAVATVRDRDAQLEAEHGPHALWLAVSHGDVIKAVLADALGMHLDAFQRIMVDPASLSVVRYTPERAFVVTMNSSSGALSHLAPPKTKRRRRRSADAVVGGGAGPEDDAASTAASAGS
ncbi:2,3-bisphosphoglycerate-dependent phosphoglycerate mutase [Nocardioides scoriae]|uniref:2,3-bisphosphoglycerate-dependent phosphoglycerate mutase n=1 Tax=Nocardioides scoriae TaxID=642780 RepID=A0A1H1NGJ9_9ACTN|nr:MSMEG_4193 family putative phosphomutase [Nocardioides scoriae]SDR98136.1 2,3-bisphosphoglycerate-dependent phosphoglycerate mutase [Nocardioides scoriae]